MFTPTQTSTAQCLSSFNNLQRLKTANNYLYNKQEWVDKKTNVLTLQALSENKNEQK